MTRQDKKIRYQRAMFAGIVAAVLATGGVAAGQSSSDATTLLSSEGKILFGEEQNSVLVIDYPENIQRVEEYLRMIDAQPQQVLIEARLVEVKLQGENSLGVNWQAFAEKGGLEVGQFRVGSTEGGPIVQSIPFKPTFYPPGSTQADDEESPFTLTVFDENINLVVSALANTFDTNILSAPRVTTVNNQEAEIKVVRELRWVVPSVQVDEGAVSITWSDADGSPRDVGILLKVTPLITQDNQVSMVLRPEVSEHISDIQLRAVAETTEVPYTIPIIDTRIANTKVVIENGQTLIMGGMIREKNTKGASKVPLLGDIPGLGWLFKSARDVKEKTELVIFVSPTIITPEVVSRMKQREEFDIGSWYMRVRAAQEEAFREAAAKVSSRPAQEHDFFPRPRREQDEESATVHATAEPR